MKQQNRKARKEDPLHHLHDSKYKAPEGEAHSDNPGLCLPLQVYALTYEDYDCSDIEKHQMCHISHHKSQEIKRCKKEQKSESIDKGRLSSCWQSV